MKKQLQDDGSVLVVFELPASVGATTVHLCGDFNDWEPDAQPLTRDGEVFRTSLTLAAGRDWRFRYLLDGVRWENDWEADDYRPNGLGTEDSVVDLTEPPAAEAGTAAPAERARVRRRDRIRAWFRRRPAGETGARPVTGAIPVLVPAQETTPAPEPVGEENGGHGEPAATGDDRSRAATGA